MDLFKEVLDYNANVKPVEDQRSDTDSGRSSAHGDREIFKDMPINSQHDSIKQESTAAPLSSSTLKVIRPTEDQIKQLYNSDENRQKYATIGVNEKKFQTNKEKDNNSGRIHVMRKRDGILKKRRSTIAGNIDEIETVRENLSQAKSTNNLDCLTMDPKEKDEKDISGSSMPDLSSRKFATLPNLRVRRKTMASIEDLNENKVNIFDLVTNISKGPEFIANSSLPPHHIDITDSKCQHKRIVSVLLLNGCTMKISCNSTTATAKQIFETVIKTETLSENFFLGICALIGGDFVFLPPELKIYKVAPQIWLNASKKATTYSENVIFTLFLRIKFFLPTLRGISSLESRHLLYLQLRKSILESHILCNDDDLITLGGLALQAEVGDFRPVMKYSDYFTISHYLPEGVYQKRKEMAKYLRNSHYAKNGVHKKEAEQNFIRYVQEMKEYGLHLYSAIWITDDDVFCDVYIAISLQGIIIFQRTSKIRNSKMLECSTAGNSKSSYQRQMYLNFDWLEIENLCFSKHILCVVVRKSESLKAKDNNRIKYKFKMDGRKSYFAFNLASEHHKFYMKLRNSFISLKSLSDELNIPIVSSLPRCTERAKIQINSNSFEATKSAVTSSDHHQQIYPSNEKQQAHGTAKNEQKSKTGSRVKNLKKSMLNDNKLLKLRNKFLKRSKSTIGIIEEQQRPIDPNICPTKEESQNKENECPKAVMTNETDETSSKIISPNRNRVKMGTRVFSSQFLNKSFENVCDNHLDLYCFDQETRRMREQNWNGFNGHLEDIHGSDDATSLRSTSVSSLYFSEKMSENYSESSPQPSEAYVIHSSIKSCNGNNFFSMQNETVSDSLLDKFNNISSTNIFSERIITRVTVIKEPASSVELTNQQRNVSVSSAAKCATLNFKKLTNNNESMVKLYQSRSQESLFLKKDGNKDGRLSTWNDGGRETVGKLTLGISIVQGSDHHVYVKDLVKNGPGDKSGIKIGDQILAVNGISLLNLPYVDSLRILQNTGKTVELIVSQVLGKMEMEETTTDTSASHEGNKCNEVCLDCKVPEVDNGNENQQKPYGSMVTVDRQPQIKINRNTVVDDANFKNDNDDCLKHNDDSREPTEITRQKDENKNSGYLGLGSAGYAAGYRKLCDISLMSAKSMPDLPKIVATIPKQKMSSKTTMPRNMGLSRKYVGPVKYPVTPVRATIGMEMHRLSLLADEDDEQVFI